MSSFQYQYDVKNGRLIPHAVIALVLIACFFIQTVLLTKPLSIQNDFNDQLGAWFFALIGPYFLSTVYFKLKGVGYWVSVSLGSLAAVCLLMRSQYDLTVLELFSSFYAFLFMNGCMLIGAAAIMLSREARDDFRL